jgi:predicted transposase YbfD/YdcC
MARKAKKLQELKGIFQENEIDVELFDDVTVLKELRERLDIITDTRHESYIRHKLLDVIMITLLAVLANANEWIEVECFAKKKEKWLKKFLELPNGIPSDDTIKELKQDKGSYKKTVEKEHSGIVTREYFLTGNIKWIYNKEKWSVLKAIGLEKKTIQKNNGKVIEEQRFFIASFTDINNFEKAVREHWGVENGLHWHLDFTFKDDKNTTMAKTGAKNLQIFKKIALALLKIVQTLYKCSLKLIRYRLSLSFDEEIERIFKMLNVEDLRTMILTK